MYLESCLENDPQGASRWNIFMAVARYRLMERTGGTSIRFDMRVDLLQKPTNNTSAYINDENILELGGMNLHWRVEKRKT